MQWDISDHQDWRVVDNTRWLNISNYQNLEARAGVYIFADVNHQVKYIGKAEPVELLMKYIMQFIEVRIEELPRSRRFIRTPVATLPH